MGWITSECGATWKKQKHNQRLHTLVHTWHSWSTPAGTTWHHMAVHLSTKGITMMIIKICSRYIYGKYSLVFLLKIGTALWRNCTDPFHVLHVHIYTFVSRPVAICALHTATDVHTYTHRVCACVFVCVCVCLCVCVCVCESTHMYIWVITGTHRKHQHWETLAASSLVTCCTCSPHLALTP